MATGDEPRSRPGGRSARVRSAVLSATLAELTEVGYPELTVEGVARRAAVHKTTIYRRWGTREQLVLEAMLEQARTRIQVSDTGSLRGDLAALARTSTASVATREIQTVLRTVVAVGSRDRALTEANQVFWAERLAVDATIVERAVARGEARRGLDAHAVVAAVLGPIYFRVLVTAEPVDDDFLDQVVDQVVRGIAPD